MSLLAETCHLVQTGFIGRNFAEFGFAYEYEPYYETAKIQIGVKRSNIQRNMTVMYLKLKFIFL